MAAPRKYPDELRERAIMMVIEAKKDPATRANAAGRIGEQLAINGETLRGWVTRREVELGERAGTASVPDADDLDRRRPLDEKPSSPWSEWNKLSRDVQDEVTELSYVGQRHPDPKVARIAEAWADVIIKGRVQSSARFTERLFGFLLRVLDGLQGLFSGHGSRSDDQAEEAWAERVLRAS